MSDLKAQFDDTGYVAISAFLDVQELAELDTAINRFIDEKLPGLPAELVYYEDKDDPGTLKQIQQLNEYDDFFHRFANSERVVCLAETLLGGPVTLKNTQYFNKFPHLGKATPPHQDGYYFMIRPQAAVTMWLSLGHADADNGAVCYVPNSHKAGLREHGTTGTLGFSQGITDWSAADDRACVQMEAGPGDILVHHSLTIHRANNNTSDRERRAIGFIFYRADVEIDEIAHATYQERLSQSLKDADRI